MFHLIIRRVMWQWYGIPIQHTSIYSSNPIFKVDIYFCPFHQGRCAAMYIYYNNSIGLNGSRKPGSRNFHHENDPGLSLSTISLYLHVTHVTCNNVRWWFILYYLLHTHFIIILDLAQQPISYIVNSMYTTYVILLLSHTIILK